MIPYFDEIVVNISLTNVSETTIEHWELIIDGISDNLGAAPPSTTNPFSLAFVDGGSGSFFTQPRWRYETTTEPIEPNATVSREIVVRARKTGDISIDYTFTNKTDPTTPFSYPGVNSLMNVKTTRIDFDGADSEIKAAIFWAIYHETGDGNWLTYNPPSLNLPCSEPGWTASNGVTVSRLEHNCNDYRYMASHTLLNGLLSTERRVGTDEMFVYFASASNWGGSMANGSAAIWSRDTCWPEFETVGIPDPNSSDDIHIASYENVLQVGRNTGEWHPSMKWLDFYLTCRVNAEKAKINAGNDNGYSVHFRDFYTATIGYIGSAVENLNSDPTDSAYSLLASNNDSAGSLRDCIDNCQNPASTGEAIDQVYSEFFNKIRNQYAPFRSSVIQPVVWREQGFKLVDGVQKYIPVGYSWVSFVYQQPRDLYNYPR